MNVADDPELVERLRAAGFDWLFIGIETPEEASLGECRKKQNLNRDMSEQLLYLQRSGMLVLGLSHLTATRPIFSGASSSLFKRPAS